MLDLEPDNRIVVPLRGGNNIDVTPGLQELLKGIDAQLSSRFGSYDLEGITNATLTKIGSRLLAGDRLSFLHRNPLGDLELNVIYYEEEEEE
jgi:hypothetical protein